LALSALLQVAPTRAASLHEGGAGSLQPALPAAQTGPSAGLPRLGFVRNPQATSSAQLRRTVQLALPASVDLSAYNPPVGNQGNVGSCTA
jgi:hypothetical protein